MPTYSTRFQLPLDDYVGPISQGAIKAIGPGVFQTVEDAMIEGLVTVLADLQIDAQTAQQNGIWTVPVGKQAIITEVIAHSNTATLAGMTDVNFGGGLPPTTPVWLDAANLSSMTSANMMLKLAPAGAIVIIDGDATPPQSTFVAEVIAGSTGAANVNIALLGFLIDS